MQAQGTGHTAELVVCASVHNCGLIEEPFADHGKFSSTSCCLLTWAKHTDTNVEDKMKVTIERLRISLRGKKAFMGRLCPREVSFSNLGM